MQSSTRRAATCRTAAAGLPDAGTTTPVACGFHPAASRSSSPRSGIDRGAHRVSDASTETPARGRAKEALGDLREDVCA